MSWSQWIALGILLLVLEVIFPTGFFMLLLGVAALVVGAIVALGLTIPAWLQWTIFAVLGVCFAVVGAKRLRMLSSSRSDSSTETVGQTVTIKGTIAPGETGEGELWGSPWRVKNTNQLPLADGDKKVVKAIEGVTLLV